MNKFMDSATDRLLFIGVMLLNCRILKILFCVTISGCMNFFVVFT